MKIQSVGTIAFTCPGLVKLEAVDEWLRNLLWESSIDGESHNDLEILRVKMLLSAKGTDSKVVFQAVRELYDKQEGVKWDVPIEQRVSRLVFIGMADTLYVVQIYLSKYREKH